MSTTEASVFSNLSVEQLIDHALEKQEGRLTSSQALLVETGSRTGRSPKDRFIVSDAITKDVVDWGSVNQPISAELLEPLWEEAKAYLMGREHYTANLQVGADPEYTVPVKVITEFAWHNLFAQHLFIREVLSKDTDKKWTIMSAPGLPVNGAADGVSADGCVIIDFTQKRVLLRGMRYAGEMKKAMFTAQNFLLPEKDVLPMHCSANIGEAGDVALFFGLSGTGKTTLSAEPSRKLVGDDEHGWGPKGIFNLEGGCYAKCIDLSKEREPLIYAAIRRGAVLENAWADENGVVDYSDDRLTKNTRVAYPREFIPNCEPSNRAGHPSTVVFLTCDCYGVLPPVSCLSVEQAAYYFLSGYTALVGSTEVGSTSDIKPTFSTCFGAPFFPRPATVYADLLKKRLHETGAKVYLINTGWTGGPYGVGKRFDIPVTRAIVDAVLAQNCHDLPQEILPGFNLSVPTELPGVDASILNPRNTWSDAAAYDKQAKELISAFKDNFKKYDVDSSIVDAGPEDLD